ncbi:MAG: ABC transporter ATP-binding protein [Gemmatimonadales bacterium]|nr:ABC transporter ATP-binding protein [Gemmatimonadales bacterium]
MIRLDRVGLRVGEFQLRDISLEVPEGGYGLVIGPSGSGKTTLLEAVAGLARIATGRVMVRGEDVTDHPPERRGVGFVYQRYHLFPHLTVADNIGYGLVRTPQPKAERLARVQELAASLGIAPLLGRGVRHLSGGEAQRVALARALAPRPHTLLLDEPFASLDPATRQDLRQLLQRLHEDQGITILQVTHDFDEALRLGNVVAVMDGGEVVQHGTPEEVFRYPASAFVARFIGAANVVAGAVTRSAPEQPGATSFAAVFQSDGLSLDVVAEREGPTHAIIQPEDIVLSREPHPSSARNRLDAAMLILERSGPLTYVHLRVGGRRLVALVTTQSADAMGLEAGDRIFATVKATAIHFT